MLFNAYVSAQLLRQDLRDHVASGVVVMACPIPRVARKRLEIQLAVRGAHELSSPGFEIMHHINNVIDPDARELRINEFTAMLDDVVEMKLRAIILAHCSGKSPTRHCSRAAGSAALRHLDDRNAGFGTFECGHTTRSAATDDQYVGLAVLDGNL